MAIVELIQANTTLSIIVISLVVTFFSTLITKWLTNQEHLKSLKARQKELQAEIKNCKGDQCKMMELQNEALKITGTMMTSSFKPILITAVPFLILVYWLKGVYTPIIGNSWIWWYIGSSIVASMIFRKLLKMA